MSVYKRGDSPFYHYDFWLKGRRFFGSTGCGTKPEAKQYEKDRRDEAKALIASGATPSEALTLDDAAGRFWLERGKYYRGQAGVTFKRSLEWLVLHAGNRRLTDFGNALVAELVAKRRGQPPLLPKKNARAKRPISNATVNRTVTEPLRRIMNRARDAWDVPVGKVAWGMHLLPEPKERVRELREHEETALNQAIRDDYLPALGFFVVSGCRLKEVVALKWKDIDWGARTISIMGKGDKPDVIPLTSELRSILWPLSGHHPEHVFTYVAQRSRTIQKTHRMIEKGKRYPITYEGLKTTWRRQGAPAVDDFRLHDTRHTAATRLLREGGNLKLVQRLLRHEDIATTAKYAHAQDEDLRAAMEAVSKSRANPRDDAEDAENMKGKQRLK